MFDASARTAVDQARHEETDYINVGASIALAKARKYSNTVSAEYITDLVRELDAIGPRMDARRLGALGALIVVDRLDLLEGHDNFGRLTRYGQGQPTELYRLVATNWRKLSEAFGGDDKMASRLQIDRSYFFETWGPFLELSPEIKAYAVKMLEDEKLSGGAFALRLTERLYPKSDLLLQRCIRGLATSRNSPWGDFSRALTAADILARNFAGDLNVEDILLRRLERFGDDEGTVAALCDGWSASGRFSLFRAMGRRRTPLTIDLKIVAGYGKPEQVANAISWASNELTGDVWDGIPFWLPSMVRRLKVDPAARTALFGILLDNPSSGEKASIPAILNEAVGLTPELRDWCLRSLKKAEGVAVAEVGMDLLAGRHRLVIHSLFDLITGKESAVL